MNRTSTFTVVMIVAVTVAFFSGTSISSTGAKPVEEQKPDSAKPPVVVGQRTAVFNMAAVMRDFHQAKYQVWLLNKKKEELSKRLIDWRTEYIKIEMELKKEPDHPRKEEMTDTMRDLARKIEDEDRKLNKQLNDDARAIISDLYDMIKAAVDKLAEQNSFQIVLAYPDAVTPDELNSPYIKELKLKPPAAQPFYVSPEIDITARIVKTLNEKHPPVDPKTKLPVDVNKLEAPGAAPKDSPPIKLPPIPDAPGSLPKTGPSTPPLPLIPAPKKP